MAIWDGFKLGDSFCEGGFSKICYLAKLISLTGLTLNVSLALLWITMGFGLLWIAMAGMSNDG